MRFLYTYLLLVGVFAFGYLCAAAFVVGVTGRIGPRGRKR